MKHIKSFENNKTKHYEENDYIFLNLKAIQNNNMQNNFKDDTPISPLAKIYKVDFSISTIYIYKVIPAIPHPENIEENEHYDKISVAEEEILRKLKPSEIKKYDAIITANKFNL